MVHVARAVACPESVEDGRIVIANRYELEARVGKGATGSVYRAYDRTLDRRVAIKLLAPGEFRLAEREAQVLARITHRNVVTIHDYGHDLGHELSHRYLVLELLDGCDFSDWLSEHPGCDEIIARFVDAGRGLGAAHRAGLIHRDFKPSNVILTTEGRVVVVDFGLAQSLDGSQQSLEVNQFTEGTLAYMAPERLAGYDSDERSDQFSFCVALAEALTGANPFCGADPLARYRSIRNGPVLRTDRHGPVPRHVLAALERGMHFDRERRFTSMDALLEELERPAVPRRERGLRPLLMAAGVACTFLFGWGVAPEFLTIEEAHSSLNLDPRADAALSMLDSARKQAEAGDTRAALADAMMAGELLANAPHDEGYCSFGAMLPDVADTMGQRGGLNEARMAYAMALRFAQDCPNLTKEDLLARREALRTTAAIAE